MKVFMINTVCGIGSTGRICTDIAERLQADGHECLIAYGRGIVPEQYRKYAVRIGSTPDVYLHCAKARIFDNVGFGSKHATKTLIKKIEDYDPDVIHLHNLHGYYINIEILFSYLKEANKPVVWTLHDCWSFTGHCAHFAAAGCEQWKHCCGNCPEKRTYPTSLVLDCSYANFKRKQTAFSGLDKLTLVTPSRWLAQLTKESFLNEYPVRVIPTGIDLNVFRPTESNLRERWGLENKFIVLGVASVWNDRKGLADMVRLAKELGVGYAVVLVGITDKQRRELSDSMIGIGRTANVRELAQIYSAADVFINPTYEDTYPTVNLEAIACGTPVVTYNTGGSVESADENCVVEQGDVAGLANIIRAQSAAFPRGLRLNRNDMLADYAELYERPAASRY